ncbi:MAG TPA: hypothetical protein VMG59_01420 [Phycisphaerae bacterium]|nr:hypothetical protein [Phycisphaerae bacterium]
MKSWRKIYGNGFALEIPLDFNGILQEDGRLVLEDPARSIQMTLEMDATESKAEGPGNQLSARAGIPVPKSPKQMQAFMRNWAGQIHSVRVAEQSRRILGTHHIACTAQGVERQGILADWLQTIWRKDSAIGWRFWAVFHSNQIVLITCRGSKQALGFLKPIVDGIVATVSIGAMPEVMKKPFIQAVVDLAKEHMPSTSLCAIDDDTLSIGGMRIKVSPLHEAYLEQPNELAENVKRFFDELMVEHTDDPNQTNGWPGIRNKVYPILVPKTMSGSLTTNAYKEDWINGLVICYQVHGSSTLVTYADCTQWGVDLEMLAQYALGNLQRMTRSLSMTGGTSNNYTLFSFPQEDALNSSRMLLPLVYKHLQPHLGKTFYMAVPDRDILLAFSAEEPATVTWLRRQVEIRYAQAAHPLSDKLFLVTPDGIVGDAAHPEPETL